MKMIYEHIFISNICFINMLNSKISKFEVDISKNIYFSQI